MRKSSPSTPPKNIDEYLLAQPEAVRAVLENLRQVIRSVVPEAQEVISYQIPAFKYLGKHLVSFAAFKSHCTFFVMSGSFLGNFQEEIKGYKQTKSGIHFTLEKPLPEALVRKLVLARAKELEEVVEKKKGAR